MDIEAYMIWIWLAVFVGAIIIEACTQDFVSIWFAVGAIVCVCVCNTGIPYWAEIIIFSIVSLVALFATRPLVKKLMDRTERKTNVDDYSGKLVKVISKIDKFNPGKIRINDVIYTAILREEDTDEISEDSVVEIVTLKGNKVVVKKI